MNEGPIKPNPAIAAKIAAGEELTDDEFWEQAEQIFPGSSGNRMSIPLEADVYNWFVALNTDHAALINQILRLYIESQTKPA